jgi:hypothetical protein
MRLRISNYRTANIVTAFLNGKTIVTSRENCIFWLHRQRSNQLPIYPILEVFVFAYMHRALEQREFERSSAAGAAWELASFNDDNLPGMSAIRC